MQKLTISFLQDKYPVRDVRGFRVVRVRNARTGEKAATRTALLTVWDAQSFEDGFFREGTRYLVRPSPLSPLRSSTLMRLCLGEQISNTMPKGKWRQSDPEIALTTRRDSRWEMVTM